MVQNNANSLAAYTAMINRGGLLRINGDNNMRYLMTGQAGCAGLGRKKAMRTIDQIAEETPARVEDALLRWGLDRDEISLISPILITGRCSDSPRLAVFERMGDDGIIRASHYETFIMAFTEKQVFLYEKIWNVRDFEIIYRTEELFYKDVTSITAIENDKYSKILLRAMGSEFYSSWMPNRYLTRNRIDAMRNLIREKKSETP